MRDVQECSPWGTLRGGELFPDEPYEKRIREFLDYFILPAGSAIPDQIS
jgi:hypothetical protein